MGAFGVLNVDSEHEFTVREIYEAATSFISKKAPSTGQTIYCHHFILEDDDRVRYKCQVCDTKETQNICNAQDTITFKVKAFKMDIHTIEILARDGRPIKPVASIPGPEVENTIHESTGHPTSARVIALQCSVAFFANRVENEASGETVMETAKKYEEYLKGN